MTWNERKSEMGGVGEIKRHKLGGELSVKIDSVRERKSEMSDEEEKTTDDRLRVTEDKLGELSVKIDSVREKSDARITDLRSVHTDMREAIKNF